VCNYFSNIYTHFCEMNYKLTFLTRPHRALFFFFFFESIHITQCRVIQGPTSLSVLIIVDQSYSTSKCIFKIAKNVVFFVGLLFEPTQASWYVLELRSQYISPVDSIYTVSSELVTELELNSLLIRAARNSLFWLANIIDCRFIILEYVWIVQKIA
jgi:hypothetical protein